MRCVCLILFTCLSVSSYSKGLTRGVKLNFQNGCVTLSDENKNIVIDEYVRVGEGDWLYFTTITDEEKSANRLLAFKKAKIRNRAIGAFLLENGIEQDKMTYKYSEFEHIWVNKPTKFKSSVVLNEELGKPNEISSSFRNIDGYSFIMATGNILEFKSMSFEGLSNDIITVTIKEYSSKVDFVKFGVTAQGDNGMLETQGMYFLQAFSNGTEVSLRRGVNYSLKIKDGKESDPFYAFYGTDKGGDLTWTKNPNQKFISMDLNETITNTSVSVDVKVVPNVSRNNVELEGPSEAEVVAAGKFGAFYVDEQGNLQSGPAPTKKKAPVKPRREMKTISDVYAESESSDVLGRYLVGKFGNLGWINCDRFYSSPETMTMQIKIDKGHGKSEFAVYMIFKNINSVLPLRRITNGNYETPKIPKGEEVTIFAVQTTKRKTSNKLAVKEVVTKKKKVKLKSKNIHKKALEKYMNDIVY